MSNEYENLYENSTTIKKHGGELQIENKLGPLHPDHKHQLDNLPTAGIPDGEIVGRIYFKKDGGPSTIIDWDYEVLAMITYDSDGCIIPGCSGEHYTETLPHGVVEKCNGCNWSLPL